MAKPKKKKDPFNPENGEFRTKMNLTKTERALKTMEILGCKSRVVYTEMAIELMNKTYGAHE